MVDCEALPDFRPLFSARANITAGASEGELWEPAKFRSVCSNIRRVAMKQNTGEYPPRGHPAAFAAQQIISSMRAGHAAYIQPLQPQARAVWIHLVLTSPDTGRRRLYAVGDTQQAAANSASWNTLNPPHAPMPSARAGKQRFLDRADVCYKGTNTLDCGCGRQVPLLPNRGSESRLRIY